MENMPENFHGSDQYQMAEDAADNMNSTLDSLEEAISYITDAQV